MQKKMGTEKTEGILETTNEEPSTSVKSSQKRNYGSASDDNDSEATLSANEDLDDIVENDKYTNLSAEDLFRLIMSDHQYLSNTFPKCFGHTSDGECESEHGRTESPIPDAAAIQHFFLKAMNLASFEPIKDDELKLKCSCSNKYGLTVPFDKLTSRPNSACKKNNLESNLERTQNMSRHSNEEPCTSKSKSASDSSLSPAQTEHLPPNVKEATDKKTAQSQWTSECKAVFEKVQQASYLGYALTLLQKMWENYLNSSYEKIRQQEIERSKTVDFCNEVRQMIEDDGRYVCQVIEEMEPIKFTTDFQV